VPAKNTQHYLRDARRRCVRRWLGLCDHLSR
jgi:hypothetical protein